MSDMPDRMEKLESLVREQREKIRELEKRVSDLEDENERERKLWAKSTPGDEN